MEKDRGLMDLIFVAIVAFIEVVAVLTSRLPVNRVVKDLKGRRGESTEIHTCYHVFECSILAQMIVDQLFF